MLKMGWIISPYTVKQAAFDLQQKETGSKTVAIATSKYASCGAFLSVQRACLIPIVLHLYLQRYSLLCVQPRSQGLSSLPPLVVGRKTLFAAGHVPSCDTNFSTGVGSPTIFVDLNWSERKVLRSKFSSPVVSFTQVRGDTAISKKVALVIHDAWSMYHSPQCIMGASLV